MILSNEKDPLYVETDKNNELSINFSQYFGYECLVTITPWDRGISWSGITDAEIESIADISELGVPFVAICRTEGAKSWLATFPDDLKKISLSMN